MCDVQDNVKWTSNPLPIMLCAMVVWKLEKKREIKVVIEQTLGFTT